MDDIKTLIHGDATSDQINAIDHVGKHARLLAGPGTGKTKTLTRRVLSLILQHNVAPESILLITFTRLAAGQLREEIGKVLEPHSKSTPQISTLHSFALKQILHNSSRVDALPRPVRIADDWEERHVIQEDLKKALNLKEISEVRVLINQLSTDWETLRIDEVGWEQQFPNAAFLGAWRGHKNQYGETLRAELVYQLKRQLSQNRDFALDGDYKHVLIDEYQDLNACDLAIVGELAKRGAELFVAGDDDQSIYGFRFASPVGIRNFNQQYDKSEKLALEICFRCDKNILQAAEFVANLDAARLPKPTRPRDNAEDGEVKILGFKEQDHEAVSIAKKIKSLISSGTKADQITILLRSDRNGSISKPIIEALKKESIDVSLTTDSEIEGKESYRIVLSMIRLVVDANDALAWRTLLQVQKNGLGAECISAIDKYAQEKAVRFGNALKEIAQKPDLLKKFGQKCAKFYSDTEAQLKELLTIKIPLDVLNKIIDIHVSSAEDKEAIRKFFVDILTAMEDGKLEDLIKAVSTSSEKIEQETKENAVNILSMHQAKGLTFDVCFIVGAEDEFIPGRNAGEKEGDERRLLYVSMTRARHKLFITYCNRRTGPQRHSGSNSGVEKRTLTRFLRDSRIPIEQLQ